MYIEGQFGQCWVNSVCVCVCVGGGGGGGGGGSYTYVLRNSLQIVLGWRVFSLLTATSMLIKHIATFNIPV